MALCEGQGRTGAENRVYCDSVAWIKDKQAGALRLGFDHTSGMAADRLPMDVAVNGDRWLFEAVVKDIGGRMAEPLTTCPLAILLYLPMPGMVSGNVSQWLRSFV